MTRRTHDGRSGESAVLRSAPVVVVVAYGADELLESCLASVAGAGDVVVVDNGGSDAAATLTRSRGGRYMRTPANVGFAAAVNMALADVAPGRDVLLLNPDAVVAADAVARLQTALHSAEVRLAATAPRLVRPDGTTERTAWPVPSPGNVWAAVPGLGDRLTRRRFLSGAVLMLNGDAIAELGGLDDRYFLYAEEADWQLRALRAGWTVAVVDDAVAEHLGAATSTDPDLRERLFHGSAELFARKWYGGAGWLVFRAGSVAAALRRLLFARDRAERRRQVLILRLYLRGPVSCLPEFARRTA